MSLARKTGGRQSLGEQLPFLGSKRGLHHRCPPVLGLISQRVRLQVLWLLPDHLAESTTQVSVFSTPGTSLGYTNEVILYALIDWLTVTDIHAFRTSRLIKRGPRKTLPGSVVPSSTLVVCLTPHPYGLWTCSLVCTHRARPNLGLRRADS